MTQSRRAYGTGTIRERNGRYQAIIRYYDVSGKRHQKAQSFNRRTDAQDWIFATRQEVRRTGPLNSEGRQTLAEFLDTWLDSSDLADLSANTRSWYRAAVEGHLVPELGRLRLDRLTPMQLDQFLTTKRTTGRLDGKKGGLGSSSLRRLHVTLSKALRYAHRMRLIGSNPMDLVNQPTVTHRDPTTAVWTLSQVKEFLTAVAGDRFFALWHLAAWTGMRRGELLGLKWSDLDLNRGVCSVRRARVVTLGGTVEVSPKSAQSKRTIQLDEETVKVLRHHRSRQAEEQLAAGDVWHETGLVFAWQDGSGPSPYWVSHRFTRLASDTALPPITLHGLRHSHATALLSAGIHPKIAQERLGHHSAAFTMDVYSSVLPTMQREAIERLSESAG